MWGTKKTLVMESTRDSKGTVWRAVHPTRGRLSIEGHDLGPGVEEYFGCSEYEFTRSLDAAETTALRELLGVPDGGDLLAAVRARFASAHELEEFLKEHGIAGTFWNRIGD
jgi:hypothetical protein